MEHLQQILSLDSWWNIIQDNSVNQVRFWKSSPNDLGGKKRACEHLIRIAKLIQRRPIQFDSSVCLSDSNWSFTQFYSVSLFALSPPTVISFRFCTDEWVLQPSCRKSWGLERKLAPIGPNDRFWLRLLVANPLNRQFPFSDGLIGNIQCNILLHLPSSRLKYSKMVLYY